MENMPNTTRKSAETLEQQHVLSNLVDNDDLQSSKTKIPDRFKDLSPDQLLTEIKIIRAQSARSEEEEDILRSYDRYVENLRQLRNEQREQINHAIEGVDDPVKRRELFIKAVSWSGPLQQRVLEKMQAYGSRSFTEDQTREASTTEEGFETMLNDLVSIAPDQIMNSLSDLTYVVTKEKLGNIIDVVIKKDPTFIARFSDELRGFYGENEYAELFCNTHPQKSSWSFWRVLEDDGVFDNIGRDRVAQLMRNCIEQDNDCIANIPAKLYEKGVVDIDLVTKIIFTDDGDQGWRNGYSRLEGIRNAWKYLEKGDREKCRNIIRNLFKTNENLTNRLSDICKDYSGIIDNDELKKIVLDKLNSKTEVFISDLDAIREVLGNEEYMIWLRGVVTQKSSTIKFFQDAVEQITNSDKFTEQEKRAFIDNLLNENPSFVFTSSNTYLSHMEASEKGKKIFELAQFVSSGTGISNISEWLPFVSDTTEQQREILVAYLLKDGDFTFTKEYSSDDPKNKNAILLKELLTKEDIIDILNKKIDAGAENFFVTLQAMRKVVGEDEDLKKLVENMRSISVRDFIQELDKVVYLYTPDELFQIIKSNCFDPFIFSDVIRSIDVWGPRLGKEKVDQLIEEHKEYVCLLADNIDTCSLYSSKPLEAEYFLKILLKSNPAGFFLLSDYDNHYKKLRTNIDLESVRANALVDEETMSFAPKALPEFWKTFDMDESVEEQRPLVKGCALMYLRILLIKNSGFDQIYKKIIDNQEMSAESEEKLLAVMAVYINLKNKGFVKSIDETMWQSIEDVEKTLCLVIENMLGVSEDTPNSESMTLFMETMKDPGPFLSYLLQYYNSKRHTEILSGMFKSISNGRYEDWKYGDAKDFDLFKQNSWLPKNITIDQYAMWKGDISTSLYESLNSSADEVADSIRKVIIDNSEHLQVDFDINSREPQLLLGEVKDELKSLGAELASLGKQVSLLRREVGMTDDTLKELLERKTQAENVRKALVKDRDVVRLSILTPEEVTSGYLIENGKKSQLISSFIENLKNNVPSEAIFVIERIEDMMVSLKKTGAEKEDVVAQDTSSPKIMIEIGETPVESCQNYERGSHNDCLLGYSEPNTKIIIVRNKRNTIIARSILRLLEDGLGNTELQVERVYSTTSSPGANKAIFEHALKKAELLGVPLVADKADVPEGIGFSVENSSTFLISKGARAPKVYVDSAGGAKSSGRYVINKAVVVKRK